MIPKYDHHKMLYPIIRDNNITIPLYMLYEIYNVNKIMLNIIDKRNKRKTRG